MDETLKIKKNEGFTDFSYYNAFSILYTVMRKRIEEIIGRFHPENGITPRDPQTNNRIYDEISFYRIKNPFEQIPEQGKPISL